jgi:hypothetical protein
LTQNLNDHVKIVFRYYSSVLEKWTVETMWAIIVDAAKGLYKLDSIPFYGPLVASDDIVFAEFDVDEQMLTYRRTVEYSGNSIVLVVMMDKARDINDIRAIFNEFGCISERVNEGYFSMEIPFDKDYTSIKRKLIDLENEGVIDYSEPSLSDKHRKESN